MTLSYLVTGLPVRRATRLEHGMALIPEVPATGRMHEVPPALEDT